MVSFVWGICGRFLNLRDFADTVGNFGLRYARTMPDISFPVFLLNGLIPFFIFSSISKRSIGAIEANQGLFNYRPVKPIDTIIARALLETLIYVAVYILLMLIVWMTGEYFEITNFLQLVLTWSLLIISFMWRRLNIYGRW